MPLRVFWRIRPDLCRIRLFPLNFRHLADRVFFARSGKQGRRKENSEDALAKEGTHSALAQLSVSAAMRKDESAVVRRDPVYPPYAGRARRIVGSRSRLRARVGVRGGGRVVIERRLHGITITRGGPHRKTQRMERSVRSRSAFCRHVAVFRADFLHAERYTFVALV